jgi:hypothetical protein
MGRDTPKSLHQGREALAPVTATVAAEAYLPSFLDHLQAVAIEFGLVQPVVAGGHALGPSRGCRVG